MIGSLVGGALKIGSAIAGGIAARQAARRQQENIDTQMKENQDWYNRRYNEDATQRADAQRLLTLTEENIKNRNKQAQGISAVMGGTEESTAAAKAANNQALADATSQIAAAGEARKDAIEEQYMARKAYLDAQKNAIEEQRVNAIAQAVSGASSVAADISSVIDDYRDQKPKK